MTLSFLGLKVVLPQMLASSILSLIFSWPLLSRNMAQIGLVLLLQSTLLLALGLCAASRLGHKRPLMQSFIYRTTLSGVALGAICSVLLAGRIHPLWTLSLPSAKPAQEVFISQTLEAHHDLETSEKVQLTPAKPAVLDRPAAAITAKEESSAGQSVQPEPLSSPTPPLTLHPFLTPPFLVACFYLTIAGLWIVGAWLQLLWLLFCQCYIWRLRKRSTVINENAALALLHELCTARHLQAPLLLSSSLVQAPLLTGIKRPAILLPAAYQTEFDTAALKAIFLHELAHLERHDCAWNLVARLTRILLWPQPLLWTLCRRMETASEEACDEAVVNGGCAPRDYANCLLDLAERLSLKRVERAVGAGVIPSRSTLGQRVQYILECSALGARPITARLRLAISLGTLAAVTTMMVLIATAKSSHTQAGRGIIQGRVLYADGRPAAGIRISAGMQDQAQMKLRYGKHGQEKPVIGETSGSAITRADGSYQLTGLATGPYNVIAETSPYNVSTYEEPPAWIAAAAQGVMTNEHKVVRAPDVMLTHGAILQGYVLDNITKKPLEGIHIGSYGPHRPETTSEMIYSVTDQHGYFKLRVAPGKNSLYIAGPSTSRYMYVHWDNSGIYKKDLPIIKVNDSLYVLSDWKAAIAEQQPPHYFRESFKLEIQPERTKNVQFRLKPMTVTIRQGEPVAEIPRTVPVTLKHASSVRHQDDKSNPTGMRKQTLQLPLTAKGNATIIGRVLYKGGKPTAGIKVVAEIQRASAWELVQKGLVKMTPQGSYTKEALDVLRSASAITDDKGTFRIQGQTTAAYNLKVVYRESGQREVNSAGPPGWVAPAMQGVWAKEGQVVHPAHDIVLTPGAVIEGQVLDNQTGTPVPGLYIGSYGPHRPHSGDSVAVTITDRQGHYALRVPPGKSEFYIYGPWSNVDENLRYSDQKKR